jgi:DegV family protein with EDD domain
MVRSGRVSPAKGLLAKLLNLKPIISLDSEGKAFGIGKTFSRKSNMKKIIKIISRWSGEKTIKDYAIVHAQNMPRAEEYSRKLEAVTGRKPAYIVDVSPVIGVHNGIGVVGIGVMFL